mmetsp:Transcript_109515/g.186115  ORF Transcript_109515/g.186115 Transcript_109515/m.186115 type:complete len:83 (-) Transcript_109515:1375-1623(-)
MRHCDDAAMRQSGASPTGATQTAALHHNCDSATHTAVGTPSHSDAQLAINQPTSNPPRITFRTACALRPLFPLAECMQVPSD